MKTKIKKSVDSCAISEVMPSIPMPVVDTSDAGNGVEVGHTQHVDQVIFAHSPAITILRELNVKLQVIIKQQNVHTNQAKALVRRFLGHQTHLSDAERKEFANRAAEIVDLVRDGKQVPNEYVAAVESILPILMISNRAHSELDVRRTMIEREMESIAKKLPAASWVDNIRGFGWLSFARIIGECGDLSNYSNPGKLWKRMGLAPFNGKSPSTWRREGGLSADDWVDVGYSPARRSVMFVIGETFIKGNRGEYKKLYDDRKAYELARNPTFGHDVSGKPLGTDDKGRPKANKHCHNRCQRYMEKRILKDLWIEWRKACGQKIPETHRFRAAASTI